MMTIMKVHSPNRDSNHDTIMKDDNHYLIYEYMNIHIYTYMYMNIYT